MYPSRLGPYQVRSVNSSAGRRQSRQNSSRWTRTGVAPSPTNSDAVSSCQTQSGGGSSRACSKSARFAGCGTSAVTSIRPRASVTARRQRPPVSGALSFTRKRTGSVPVNRSLAMANSAIAGSALVCKRRQPQPATVWSRSTRMLAKALPAGSAGGGTVTALSPAAKALFEEKVVELSSTPRAELVV